MNQSCPYCGSLVGYYQNQQVKRKAMYCWDGTPTASLDDKIFYHGKTMRCLKCDEKVTSFVKGLGREK